ncbi:calcium/sodium antiporter [Alteromonas oceanisediminis]|uniref:calcium/sodium antiporter n=1 Tax=Alteromonas oceanisediminis TaxID=2836180 RepID=UPI001BD9B62F|nr:calcium/sodium antiporter [Alteromonas oceanisediminis]MBT0586035.1 calcium/sodium antiporter [Alteromonas oceanisediminis]
MILPSVAIVVGLVVLLWSAGKFVDGAAGTARYFGMSPLLIGMLVIGFGTSAPEMIVSVFAASQGNPGLALGNAYGSNIANIALILGLTALISPIAVRSEVLKKELPILLGVTLFSVYQLIDLEVSHDDAYALLGIFAALMAWSIYSGLNSDNDALADDVNAEVLDQPIRKNVIILLVGLLLLIASSRLLVWGAVEVATFFGVSDVVIGLTIIAIGTSLPELASSLMAVKKGEHELALGNVIGSNLFNTLGVIGLAGVIAPMNVDPAFLWRDSILMIGLTVALFIFCIGLKGPGRLNRLEGGMFVLVYIAYMYFLLASSFSA